MVNNNDKEIQNILKHILNNYKEFNILSTVEEEILQIFLEKYDGNVEKFVKVNLLLDFPEYIKYNINIIEELYYKGYFLSKPTISVSGSCWGYLSEEALLYFQLKEELMKNMSIRLNKKEIEVLDLLTELVKVNSIKDGNITLKPEVYEGWGFGFSIFNDILESLNNKDFLNFDVDLDADLDGNLNILFFDYKYEEYKESISQEQNNSEAIINNLTVTNGNVTFGDGNKIENTVEEKVGGKQNKDSFNKKLFWQILIPIVVTVVGGLILYYLGI